MPVFDCKSLLSSISRALVSDSNSQGFEHQLVRLTFSVIIDTRLSVECDLYVLRS